MKICIQWMRFMQRNRQTQQKTSSSNQQPKFDRDDVTNYVFCLKSGNLA